MELQTWCDMMAPTAILYLGRSNGIHIEEGVLDSMIDMKLIARLAGVDVSTVSRALHNSPRVKAETRERIKKIAIQQDYIPNDVARGLVERKTNSIGVLIPEFINTFYAELIEGLELEFIKNDYSMLIGKSNFSTPVELKLINMFLAKRVDGIILCSLSHDAVKSLREQKKNIPHVLVDTYENYKDFSSINIDNEYAVRCIVDHLVKLGHREFGFIGDRIVTPHRMQSFQFYLASHGINVDPENIRIGSERYETGGYLRMKEILSGRNIPTAVFAETDNLAIGAMSAAKKMTYRIPEDISIIGFDDIVASSFTEIPLTTMYQPKKKMGQMAARMLIDHIKGATDDKVVQVVLKPELIVRSTTGIPRD